jgi:mycothiol maleylpyruvate isomerase-like protein
VGTQEQGADPQSPQELRDRTERSWRGWIEATDAVPPERMTEPMVGHWSAQDLLGHVAFWEDWVVGECQRILAGEPATSEDLDPLNQQQVEESKARTLAEQRRYGDEAHARLMAFLETIEDGEPRLPALVQALEWETYLHYDEHAGQVRGWLEAQGLPVSATRLETDA